MWRGNYSDTRKEQIWKTDILKCSKSMQWIRTIYGLNLKSLERGERNQKNAKITITQWNLPMKEKKHGEINPRLLPFERKTKLKERKREGKLNLKGSGGRCSFVLSQV